MSKIVFLLMSALICLLSCKSNYTRIGDKNANYIPYYLKIYEADSLYLTNNFERSYKILDTLFSKFQPINITGYYEYGTYLASGYLSGNYNKFKKKVKYNYKNFGNIFIVTQHGMNLKDSILNKSKINLKDVINFKKQYLKKNNITLRKKIEQMIIKDQDVRKLQDIDKIKRIDKNNKISIDSITRIYGYPGFDIIGSDNFFEDSADFNILLIHQVKPNDLFYERLVYNNMLRGKCTPMDFAVLVDRRIWLETDFCDNPHQLYGSYVNSNNNSLGLKVLNSYKLNQIRKSVGLSFFGYEFWRNKIIFK